jgi:hypothetical protein
MDNACVTHSARIFRGGQFECWPWLLGSIGCGPSRENIGFGMVPGDQYGPHGRLPVREHRGQLRREVLDQPLLPPLEAQGKQTVFCEPRPRPPPAGRGLPACHRRLRDPGIHGQPGCQSHGDQQVLHRCQHRDLPLLPLPPMRCIIAQGGFNRGALVIEGEDGPMWGHDPTGGASALRTCPPLGAP